MERKYNPGDQVRLRSGGPVMTAVRFIEPESTLPVLKTGYEVTWFDPKGVLQTAVLAEELLEPFVDELEPSI